MKPPSNPGATISPDLAWLIDRLAVNPPEGCPGDYDAHVIDRHAHVVEYHALQIRGHWLMWRWRGDNAAIRIRGTQRPYAKRVAADRGPENELKRLRAAARGRSDKRLQTAWLGVIRKTHSLIDWPPVPPPIRREVDSAGKLVAFERAAVGVSHRRVSVRGHASILPRRTDAVPLIEAALQKLEAIPAAKRRKREQDTLADDAARAVCVAYFDLTGRAGITWDIDAEKYQGGLIDLARDIEARFGGGPFSIEQAPQKYFPVARKLEN